jgi:phospholipid/cholesterol/gamma-HCH transport system permease protein
MPRLFALACMMPLLCVYADLMGVLGGFVVANGMLGVSAPLFFHQLAKTVSFQQVVIGIAKSLVFGVIVAIAGCFNGLNSGRSAADVGAATTQAVVASILTVIIADGIFAVTLQCLGL